eukprot:3922249-Amphidinium_carterae.1
MRSALKSSRVEVILQHLPKPAAVSSASSSNIDDPRQAFTKQVSTLKEIVRQVRSQPHMPIKVRARRKAVAVPMRPNGTQPDPTRAPTALPSSGTCQLRLYEAWMFSGSLPKKPTYVSGNDRQHKAAELTSPVAEFRTSIRHVPLPASLAKA